MSLRALICGVNFFLILSCGSLFASESVDVDWIDKAPILSMPIRPAENSSVLQANPDFSWPLMNKVVTYKLEIAGARGGVPIQSVEVMFNWHTFPTALPPGKYWWRVSAGAASGRWRSFSVTESAATFTIPNWLELPPANHAHPDSLSILNKEERDRLIKFTERERRAGWRKMALRVYAHAKTPNLVEPPPLRADSSPKDKLFWTFSLPKLLEKEIRHVEEASLLWKFNDDRQALHSGMRRLLALARFDPDGATAYEPSHHASRNLLWALIIGYDRFRETLSAEEKTHLMRIIDRRLAQIESSLDGRARSMSSAPLDSHGWMGLQGLGAMFSVVGHELPNGVERTRKWLPWALNYISPWGGDDGGYGNGTAYASWNVEILIRYWDAIQSATGIDVYSKPSVRNLVKMFCYFTPPAAKTHVFGDGAEKRVAQYVALALAQRVSTLEAQWLRDKLLAEDASDPLILTAPASAKSTGESLGNSVWLQSTGWVALHSDLAAEDRYSVYFKSSPYGSIVHSHADQNGFVIHRAGRQLIADSGYYDWYGSPHRIEWYQTTRAHNAITFDGGKGQLVSSKASTGKILAFRDEVDVAYVSGAAAQSYGLAIKKANRTLIYFRPNDVLVVDVLESDQPRLWEWNFHAEESIASVKDAIATPVSAVGGACIEPLLGDNWNLVLYDRFPRRPEGIGDVPEQSHGLYVRRAARRDDVLVFYIRLDCKKARGVEGRRKIGGGVEITNAASRVSVHVDGDGLVTNIERR
jgi:hypothetical protein